MQEQILVEIKKRDAGEKYGRLIIVVYHTPSHRQRVKRFLYELFRSHINHFHKLKSTENR